MLNDVFAMNKTGGRLVRQRRRPLAASILALLSLVPMAAMAATTWTVNTCDDNGATPGDSLTNHTGSLRFSLFNALSGDTIDLSHLPQTCGTTNSTITLAQQITVTSDALTLLGPAPGSGTVAISGNHSSRVFRHTGNQTLFLANLTIMDGNYQSGSAAGLGGCIYSSGNVLLSSSTVSGCIASSTGSFAYGGGIYTRGDLSLIKSNLSGNSVDSTNFRSYGGGAYVQGNFNAKYSTVDSNTAHQQADSAGSGGGVYVISNVTLVNTTLSRNRADFNAGLFTFGSASVTDSTVSGNVAARGVSAMSITGSAAISNSTIAFNTSYAAGSALGLDNATLTLQSSIVASNVNASGAADIEVFNSGTVVGANNIVNGSTVALPAGTIDAPPKLGPLRLNGGLTQTHALLAGSPAIGKGNNAANQDFDQRGRGYPRVSGTAKKADIGAFQFDSIFANEFD